MSTIYQLNAKGKQFVLEHFKEADVYANFLRPQWVVDMANDKLRTLQHGGVHNGFIELDIDGLGSLHIPADCIAEQGDKS